MNCPCEENMEAWHNAKISKYMPLKSVIENNGWNVDLFAVEVGVEGTALGQFYVVLKA